MNHRPQVPGYRHLTLLPGEKTLPRIAVIRFLGVNRIIGEVAESAVIEDSFEFTPSRFFAVEWGQDFGRNRSGDEDFLRAAVRERMSEIIGAKFYGAKCPPVKIKSYRRDARRRVIQ